LEFDSDCLGLDETVPRIVLRRAKTASLEPTAANSFCWKVKLGKDLRGKLTMVERRISVADDVGIRPSGTEDRGTRLIVRASAGLQSTNSVSCPGGSVNASSGWCIFIMQRKQLLSIATRAESVAATEIPRTSEGDRSAA
jgi:hypothetical protein